MKQNLDDVFVIGVTLVIKVLPIYWVFKVDILNFRSIRRLIYKCVRNNYNLLSMVPYATGPAVNFLNSMILHVSVPVLSENINSIYPSSSLRLDELTPAGMS